MVKFEDLIQNCNSCAFLKQELILKTGTALFLDFMNSASASKKFGFSTYLFAVQAVLSVQGSISDGL